MPHKKPSNLKPLALRAFRAALLIAIILSLRAAPTQLNPTPPTLTDIQKIFPTATTLKSQPNAITQILNAQKQPLGYTLQTLPQTQNIIGYAGPSNVLIALNNDNTVIGAKLLTSGDTHDHVKQIQRDKNFPAAFNNWTFGQNNPHEIDAVSGATLTSLAIIQSVTKRLGGSAPSLKFPTPPTLDEAKRFFPEAARLGDADNTNAQIPIFNAEDQLLGHILRTSPQADHISGYQGPSDSLIALDRDRNIIGVTIGQTYDNQKYVDYIRNDRYFTHAFDGLTLDELAALDPNTQRFPGIDGVSGATMTSVAMIDALIQRAKISNEIESTPNQLGVTILGVNFLAGGRDIATLLAIALACFVAFTRHRANPKTRLALQIYLVLVLGLWVGDMLSLALLAGWTHGAIPFKSAPGLVALVAVAFILPITTRKQIYCRHLCPHGAAQELAFRLTQKRIAIPSGLKKILKSLPLITLLAAVIITALNLPISLTQLEPFDAWVFAVAPLASIAIAVISLLAATVTPLPYCKYACPTGLILNYTRPAKHTDRLTQKDFIATALLAISFALNHLT